MAPPGGGRNQFSQRVMSCFVTVNVTAPNDAQLKRIFGTILNAKLVEFDDEVGACVRAIGCKGGVDLRCGRSDSSCGHISLSSSIPFRGQSSVLDHDSLHFTHTYMIGLVSSQACCSLLRGGGFVVLVERVNSRLILTHTILCGENIILCVKIDSAMYFAKHHRISERATTHASHDY